MLLCFMTLVPKFSQSSELTGIFSVDYFRTRKVPHVCVVDCELSALWIKDFSVLASNNSIAVSSFKTSKEGWKNNMAACVLQRNHPVGVLVKTSCVDVEDILHLASENTWLTAQHFWLIIDNQPFNYSNDYSNSILNNSGIINIMSQMNISVDADIKIASFIDQKTFKMTDIFNFGKVQGGGLNIADLGHWSPSSGFSANMNLYKYYRRWDFGQWRLRTVSVATVPQETFDPSFLTSELPVPGVSVVTRTSGIIISVVADIHNIKLDNSVTDRWISHFEKNNTKVAANSLFYRQQDLTSVLRIMTPYTYKLSYLYPSLTGIETRYYYRIPTSGPGRYENQFLRPLSAGAWRGVVVVCAVCAVLLAAASRFESRPHTLQYALFSVTANVCQQFFEDEVITTRSSTARKLTLFITGLSCVLIYNYYTSSVVSWLLNGPPPSITSLQELLESPLDLIYQDVGYTRSWLSDPTYFYNRRNIDEENNLRRKVLKKSQESIFKPLVEGIALVKAGGYAYHTEPDDANRLISRTFTQSELCELGSLQSMEKNLLYPAVQKDSPYREFLCWSLLRLMERGIVSAVQSRTFARPVSCEGSFPRPLALGGAAPAFIMLALGYCVSTAIMLLERTIANRYKHRQNRRYRKKT